MQYSLWQKAFSRCNYSKAVFLLLLICTFISPVYTQSIPPSKVWDKTFGGPVEDYLRAMVATSDGGYLLGGYSFPGLEGGESEVESSANDYSIVKIDRNGNKEWNKTFGGDNYDFLYSIVNTADSGYLLGGYSLSGISGDKSEESRGGYDYWIVKIDKKGNKEWDKTFGGTDYDFLYSIVTTSDGGFLLGGNSGSGIGGDKSAPGKGAFDYWVIKIDSSGNKIWDKTYGGTDFDYFKCIIRGSFGGYLLGGYSQSSIGADKSDTGRGFYDYWIVKIDDSGNKEWDKTFGGNNSDQLVSMISTSDGGYLLGGNSYSNLGADKSEPGRGFNDYWIIKTDNNGNKEWDKTFGGMGSEYFASLIATSDSGFLVGGSSSSLTGGDKSEASSGEDFWIVKTDSSGNNIWDKTYGGTKDDVLISMVATKDTSYLLGGQSNSGIGGDKSEASQGSYDFWVLKLGRDTAKRDQTIVFDSLPDKTFGDSTFIINAKSSSGLPVTFSVVSGPAAITDSTLTLTGAGVVTVQALQAGDSVYNPAPSVNRTFEVHKATPVVTWIPASLIENVPLGEEQLNAAAAFKGLTLEGTFVYTPPAGTILPIGTHVLEADFTSADSINFNSVVDITRNIKVNAYPIISLSTPINNATYIAPANIKLTAAASVIEDTIRKVEFYDGRTLLHTEYLIPYGFFWKDISAGSYTLTAKAYANSGLVTTSAAVHITIVPNKVPTVHITEPEDNKTFTGPVTIHLEAVAEDSDGTISKVEFYNGSALLRTEYLPPYTCTWKDVPVGQYDITARATDNMGAVTTSAAVNISVIPDIAPTVSIAQPANKDSFIAPATISLIACAGDTDGEISKVEFYNDTTLLRTEYWRPYTCRWLNVPEGTYTITAVATDEKGLSTTSAPVTLTVMSQSESIVSNKRLSTSGKTRLDNNSLKLYPNPANTKINIYTPVLQQDKAPTILVMSASGVLMKTIQLMNLPQSVQLDVSAFAAGVYTVKAIIGDEIIYKQFLKF